MSRPDWGKYLIHIGAATVLLFYAFYNLTHMKPPTTVATAQSRQP